MRTATRSLGIIFLALVLPTLSDHAQTAPSGTPLSPELARRVQIALRAHAPELTPDADINISPRTPSTFPGYDQVTVVVKTADGKSSTPLPFLISTDDKTFAQLNQFAIPPDYRDIVSASGRPPRGGPANAPVTIVAFDDLECPWCARMHQAIFPLLLQRYGNLVHVVYRDFPLYTIHPWAVRAAIDVNCLGEQSPDGYWDLVDYIHAHYDAVRIDPDTKPGEALQSPDAGNKITPPLAAQDLERYTREEAARLHIDSKKLDACLAKQDTSAIDASVKLGETLGIDGTPAFFINGERVAGLVSPETFFHIVDQAIRDAGQTPPPPYVPPAPIPTPAAPKPGN